MVSENASSALARAKDNITTTSFSTITTHPSRTHSPQSSIPRILSKPHVSIDYFLSFHTPSVHLTKLTHNPCTNTFNSETGHTTILTSGLPHTTNLTTQPHPFNNCCVGIILPQSCSQQLAVFSPHNGYSILHIYNTYISSGNTSPSGTQTPAYQCPD